MALSEKNKGELMIGIAAIILLLGLGFVGYAGYYGHKHNTLRSEGLQVDARVADVHSETSGSRRSRSTSYKVTVDFSARHGKPFRSAQESKAAGKPAPKSGSELVDRLFASGTSRAIGAPPDTRTTLAQMSYDRYSTLNLGASVQVVFLPADKTYAIEAQTLSDYSSWPPFLAGLLIAALGGGLMYWGLKKRALSPVT